jgi:hypothetical protein
LRPDAATSGTGHTAESAGVDDFRESNPQQADHMPIKMRAIGCRIVEASKPGEPVTGFRTEEVQLLAALERRR